jgi:hypothetical protein
MKSYLLMERLWKQHVKKVIKISAYETLQKVEI